MPHDASRPDAESSTASVWRLAVVGALGLLLGYTSASAVRGIGSESTGASSAVAVAPLADEVSQESPRAVVVQQMQALTLCAADPSAMERVYALASFENRAATGPLDRFSRMVWAEPYSALILNRGYAVGAAFESGPQAAVLVTLVDSQRQLRAFRFYLSRDAGVDDAPWFTDAVLMEQAVGVRREPPPAPAPREA